MSPRALRSTTGRVKAALLAAVTLLAPVASRAASPAPYSLPWQLRPTAALSAARCALDAPMSKQKYSILQLDIPVAF